MNSKEYVMIDQIPVEINDEKNLLELIRKAGVKMPTFCYHSELSRPGKAGSKPLARLRRSPAWKSARTPSACAAIAR